MKVAVSLIEAELTRPYLGTQAEVPLAEQRGDVAPFFQHLGECGNLPRKAGGAAAIDGSVDAKTARRTPCQQPGTSRGASGIDIMSLQSDTCRSQFVEMRCTNLRIVIADVAPAQVVGNEQEDIRRLLRLVCRHETTGQHPPEKPADRAEPAAATRDEGSYQAGPHHRPPSVAHSAQDFLQQRKPYTPAPFMTALETVHPQGFFGIQCSISTAQPLQRPVRPLGGNEPIAGADFPNAGTRRDQRADPGHAAIAQQPRNDLGTTAITYGHTFLHHVEGTRNHGDSDARLQGSRQHGHPAAVGKANAGEAFRIDLLVTSE